MARNLFRILFSGLVCIMIFTVSVVNGTELYIPTVKAKSGQLVNVPIMIDQVDNLAGVKLVLKYDAEVLTYKKATKAEQTSSLMHVVNDRKPGVLIVVMAGPVGIKGKEFSLLSITFETKKDLKSNHTTQIIIAEAQLMSDQLKDVKAQIKVGDITIIP